MRVSKERQAAQKVEAKQVLDQVADATGKPISSIARLHLMPAYQSSRQLARVCRAEATLQKEKEEEENIDNDNSLFHGLHSHDDFLREESIITDVPNVEQQVFTPDIVSNPVNTNTDSDQDSSTSLSVDDQLVVSDYVVVVEEEKPKRKRAPAKKKVSDVPAEVALTVDSQTQTTEQSEPKPKKRVTKKKVDKAEEEEETKVEEVAEVKSETPKKSRVKKKVSE